MEESFRFWGYGPRVWHELVGPQKLIQIDDQGPLETKFGRLWFTEEALNLLEDFREEIEEGISAYIRLFHQGAREGRAIIRLEADNPPGSIALVTVDSLGRYHFYFDLDETISFTQQEKYVKRSPPFYVRLGLSPEVFPRVLRKAALFSFALARTFLSQPPSRPAFPRFSKDFSVDLWRFLVRTLVERHSQIKDETGIPLWPKGKRYAVVLNHDVDTEWGFKNDRGIKAFREIEEKKGLRSAWMVVGNLAEMGRSCLRNLVASGHEVGFHGPDHSHSLAYLPENKIRERLSRVSRFLNDFNCLGFRSPSYHHTETLYRALDPLIHYDMSMHDVFENVNSLMPSLEGCSTCFPFRIEGTKILEIPTTVTEDFILEMKLGSPLDSLKFQLGLIEKIKKRQGVVNLLTHPEPQWSARPAWFQNYDSLLQEVSKDSSAWITLPRDLYTWWDQREKQISQK